MTINARRTLNGRTKALKCNKESKNEKPTPGKGQSFIDYYCIPKDPEKIR